LQSARFGERWHGRPAAGASPGSDGQVEGVEPVAEILAQSGLQAVVDFSEVAFGRTAGQGFLQTE